ncbi:MAG: hypothetical protein RLZZ488_585 [Pseudomonadota bacterium]|jgi:hypothetical protein
MSLKAAVVGVVLAGELFTGSARAACFPPNKLHLQPIPHERSNISQAQFNSIIRKAEDIYAPVFRAHRATLKIYRYWDDDTVNASANQSGSLWEVNMYGGLARRPEVTPDGFTMVLCHELGHHLGGFSFYNDDESTWAANEGQSDYFATQACAREMWKDEPEENTKARKTVKPFAKKVCDTNFTLQPERDICYRTSMAGLSLATLLAKLRKAPAPKFETPDTSIVDVTFDEHPDSQCRLDTYVAGSLCSVPFKMGVIPAKRLSNKFGAEAEREAGKSSCLARDGWLSAQRPRCWFKPLFEFDGLIAQKAEWADSSGNARAEPGEQMSLNMPLSNKLTAISEQVTGELFSRTAGVTVLNPKVRYSDIPSGTIVEQSEPFRIQIAQDFSCGHPFELIFRASAKTGAREFPIRWHTGPKIAADVILGRSLRDVRVPDSPGEGVSISFKSSTTVSAQWLALDLEVEGIYPEENDYRLVLPDGSELNVDVGGLFESGSKATASIKLPRRMPLAGDWVLKIRDLQEDDTVVLKSVRLRAPLAEAVRCSP